MYQYTVNGTRMVSLVSMASPELIVTWGPVDIGSEYSGDNDVPALCMSLKLRSVPFTSLYIISLY